MPGFFRRFFLSDFGPPPPPDQAHQPTFPGQRIVEIVYSDSKRERVFITVDDTGDYRISVEWTRVIGRLGMERVGVEMAAAVMRTAISALASLPTRPCDVHDMWPDALR
jgi:hypothetical protein